MAGIASRWPTSRRIGRAGGRAMQVTGDVTRYTDIEAMRLRIERELAPVDVLVANAGGKNGLTCGDGARHWYSEPRRKPGSPGRPGRKCRSLVTDSTAGAPPAPVMDALYDARRGVHYTKPVLRGWLHLLWFEASLVLGTLLLVRAHGAARITAVAVYAASVSSLFGISALYHRGNWTDAWRRRLQRLDHAMIFFLIAGTATPAFLLAMHGALGLACLIVIWTLTLTAAGIRMRWMTGPERLVGATFLALGWMGALALPAVWIHGGVAPGALMLAGGLLYTAGAISYHRRWLDRYPSIFGYHEVFHAFVCAAATCQYIAIALLVS
jgi:hemolysin III